jgi:uroporphyrinogen decarboxylase
LAIDCAEGMLRAGYQFDGVFVFDDHGYRNATLFSPQVYHDVLKPHHARLCNWAHDHDWPVILHSCGCVRERVPDFIDAGFDCLQPLEVKAGMDLVDLKRRYGDRMAFMGGIDVRCMCDPDPAVIEREIADKFAVAMQGSGYLYHSDHSVPDDISFEQYKRVIDLVRKYGRYD